MIQGLPSSSPIGFGTCVPAFPPQDVKSCCASTGRSRGGSRIPGKWGVTVTRARPLSPMSTCCRIWSGRWAGWPSTAWVSAASRSTQQWSLGEGRQSPSQALPVRARARLQDGSPDEGGATSVTRSPCSGTVVARQRIVTPRSRGACSALCLLHSVENRHGVTDPRRRRFVPGRHRSPNHHPGSVRAGSTRASALHVGSDRRAPPGHGCSTCHRTGELTIVDAPRGSDAVSRRPFRQLALTALPVLPGI